MDAKVTPGQSAGGGTRLSVRLACLVMALAAVLAWSNTFHTPFIFDDNLSIVENPTIRSLWPPHLVLPEEQRGTTVDGRPLTNYSFALSYALSGESTTAFHIMNLLIHLLAGFTLFGVVRRTLARPPLEEKFGGSKTGLALAVALLWLVHPLQTESVTYIVQRAESLSSLFYLCTLYFAIRAMERAEKPGWKALAFISCLCGVASKEIAVSAPLIVLLYDRCFFAGSFGEALRVRLRLHLALFSTWLVLAALLLVSGTRNETVGYMFGLTGTRYFLTQLWAITLYLKLSFWPSPLILDRGMPIVKETWRILAGGAVVLTLATVTLRGFLRNRPVGFAGALFFSVLAPTSSFIPINQTISEHRMYLVLSVVVAVAVLGFYSFWIARKEISAGLARAIPGLLLGSVGLTLISMTLSRNADYGTTLSIWQDTVIKAPDNPRALKGLADEYIYYAKEPLKAIPLVERALRLVPEDEAGCIVMGDALSEIGEYEKSIEWYEKALRIDPESQKALNNLATSLLALDRPGEALVKLEKVLAINPDFESSRYNMGLALLRLERPAEASACLEVVVKAKPDWVKARYEYARALMARGDAAKAAQEFGEVARRLPESRQAAESYENALRIAREKQPPEPVR